MAYRKINETSLTAVANAIREKTGTTEELIFPEGFVAAVENIPEGIESGVSWDNAITDVVEVTVYGTRVPGRAFHSEISLKKVNFKDSLTTIGTYAFYGCTDLALTSLPNSVTTIGQHAFQDCENLALTSLPDGLTIVGVYVFSGCTNLALTSLPDSVTTIGDRAFSSCTNLALTSLPDGLTTIGEFAFYYCTNLALTSLPDSVTTIKIYAFASCNSLTKMDLKNVSTIASQGFRSCSALETVILRKLDSICTLSSSSAFTGTPIASGTGYIYVPSTLIADYQAATNWSTYSAQFRAIEDYPDITGGTTT